MALSRPCQDEFQLPVFPSQTLTSGRNQAPALPWVEQEVRERAVATAWAEASREILQ